MLTPVDIDNIKAIPIMPIEPANDVNIVLPFLVNKLLKLSDKAVKKDIDVFTISLFSIKHTLKEIIEGMKKANVKTPITGSDYITVLGYALVMANIRMTDIKMSNSAYKVYNDIAIMLNEDLKY